MFLKVLKYDFKSVFFKLLPLYIVLPCYALIIRIFDLILKFDNELTNGILITLSLFFLLLLVFSFVYSIVVVIIRYTKSLFKDQGYLTHTLPVNKHCLLLSQIAVCLISSACTGLVVILATLLAYSNSNILNTIIAAFQDIINQMGISLWDFVLELVSSVLENTQYCLLVFLGIALGHSHAKNKNLMSVVYCITFFFGLMITSSIINSIVLSITNKSGFTQIYNVIELIVVCLATYAITIFTMNKQLNLE